MLKRVIFRCTCLLLLITIGVGMSSAWWIDCETERLALAGERADAEWVRQWMMRHQDSRREHWQQQALLGAAYAAVNVPDPYYQQEKTELFLQTLVEGRPEMPDSIAHRLCLIACGSGCRNAVERLLSRGLEVNRADAEGNTPLTKAAGCGHAEIVRLLLRYGADPSAAAIAAAHSGMALGDEQAPSLSKPEKQALKRNQARYVEVRRLLTRSATKERRLDETSSCANHP